MSPALSKPQSAKLSFLRSLQRVVAHWRAIVLLLILPCVVFLVARFDEFARSDRIGLALLLIFIASQIFWIGRLVGVGERFIPRRPRRVWLVIMASLVYLFIFLYSYPEWASGHTIRADDYRPQSMVIHAAFWWWLVGSLLAFPLVIAFGAADRMARAAGWVYRKARTAIHQPFAAADAGSVLLSLGRRITIPSPLVIDTVARPPSHSGADCGASQRHSLRRCRLWASLRAAERRNRSSARPAGSSAQGLRWLSHRPAFRYSHWPLHHRGLHSPLRRHHQRIKARLDRVDR